MNTNKILMAGVAGGVVFFLLGWLFYDVLLMDFMMENSGLAPNMHKDPVEMWGLIVSNLAWGFLFAIMFGRWAVVSAAQGAKRAAAVGFLVALYIDLTMYATSNIFTMKTLVADIAVMTIMAAIGGGVVAMVLNRTKKA